MKAQLRQIYRRGRSDLIKRFRSYDVEALSVAIHELGIQAGDTVMVHSALNADNGFTGNAKDIINLLKSLITQEGLLVMPSMPYADSSRAFLERAKPMNVRRTPSHMGLISEVFRRNKEVLRSLNPIHPLLAWGQEAESFLQGHEQCQYSFGSDSPFEKLLHRNAKVLCFDVGFEYITFTHFVEDQLKQHYHFSLYEDEPLRGTSIDYDGNELHTDCYVLSDISRHLRREERLIMQLEKQHMLKHARIGNTKLLSVNCEHIISTARDMISHNNYFFASPQ